MEDALLLTANDYTHLVDPARIDSATATCWLIESSERYDESRAISDINTLQNLLVLKLVDNNGYYITFLKTKNSTN